MKKLPTLHILNGDASVPAFKVANLPGHMFVWREILASGPTVYSMPQEAFWQMRQRYITQTFQASAEDYQEKVLNELPKLENANHFFEVVLWFDSDLVCQINLLFLLSQLTKKRPAVISVCTSSDGAIAFKKHEQLQHQFDHRQMMEASQLEQATILWKLYAGTDPLALQAYLQENVLYSDQLRIALTLHLQRFPDERNLLGKHQELLLSAILSGAETIEEIQKSFWQHDPGYGFGDWQLEDLLKEMDSELIILNERNVTLTEAGKGVLHGRNKFVKDIAYSLGGVQLKQQRPAWCRDSDTGQIKFCSTQHTTP